MLNLVYAIGYIGGAACVAVAGGFLLYRGVRMLAGEGNKPDLTASMRDGESDYQDRKDRRRTGAGLTTGGATLLLITLAAMRFQPALATAPVTQPSGFPAQIQGQAQQTYASVYMAGILAQRRQAGMGGLTGHDAAALIEPLEKAGLATTEDAGHLAPDLVKHAGEKGIDVVGDLLKDGIEFIGNKLVGGDKPDTAGVASVVQICTVYADATKAPQNPHAPPKGDPMNQPGTCIRTTHGS